MITLYQALMQCSVLRSNTFKVALIISVSMSIHLYINIYPYLYVYIYNTSIYIYIYMYVCIYVCIMGYGQTASPQTNMYKYVVCMH